LKLRSIFHLGNPRQAIARLDPDEKSTVISNDGGPNRNIINESGLYSLIMGSRKPEAKAFRKWVTSEVLPQIRKTGKYAVAQAPALPNFSNPSAAARAWAEEYDAKQAALQQAAALSMRVEEMRPAQELVDVIANTEGAKEINDCAKELKIDPLKLLRKWMLENEWIFEKTIKGRKHTFAYQDKASRGWLVHDRKIIATGEGIDYVMVTEKGFVELGKRYLKDNPFNHEEFREKTTPKKRKTNKES
jgi:prophage antirepressor-like protein